MRVRADRFWTLVFAFSPLLAGASNLSFLGGSTISNFSKQDVTLMMDTAEKVLDSENPRATASWNNPSTGNSGEIAATGGFISTAGHSCKRIRVLNRARTGARTNASTAEHTVCQVPDRGWLLNPDARPVAAEQ